MQNRQIIDPLTNTISRKYILSYVQYLIRNRIPFTLGMIDVDNFKNINDTYGHAVGDTVLSTMSKRIMDSMDECAWLGRYGGDEFMIVYEGVSKYEEVWQICHNIYLNGVRKPIVISDDLTLNVTCTSGYSAFPTDAKNYKDLFANCDKCLYRGKMKGRNCFIIYVESLHKKIDVRSQAKASLFDRISKLYDAFETPDKKTRLLRAMECIAKETRICGISYYNKKKIRASYLKDDNYGEAPAIPEVLLKRLETDKHIKVNDYHNLKKYDKDLCDFCYRNNLLSFIIYKVENADKDLGYIMFYDSDYARIWQPDDETLFLVFVKTLSCLVSSGQI